MKAAYDASAAFTQPGIMPGMPGLNGASMQIGYSPSMKARMSMFASQAAQSSYWQTQPGLHGLGQAPSWIERVRMWIWARKGRRMIMRTAAMGPAVGPSVASAVASSAAYATKAPTWGLGPATQSYKEAGLKITSGAVQSGSDIMPPRVVMPELTAGTQIAPQYAVGYPFEAAIQPLQYVQSPYAQGGAYRAYTTFFRRRTI